MQLIYVHQSLPFTRWKKWRWWNRQERTTWFYRYIYGFAMRISFMIARDYKVAVQAEWIKDCIVNFFGICALKIVVIKPRATIINDYSIKKSTELLNCDKINFFYPASGIIYKNHSILFAALAMLKVQDHDLFQRINIILTLGPDDRLRVQAEHLGINEAFTWAGYISHATCFDIYRNARCLLFPSFVETVGLPLLEAAACGMPVIASDLPFSRDTLAGYTAVTFARFDSAQDWMDSIRCTATAPATRAKPHRSQDQGDWSSMIAFAIGGEAC
jgi:glycosyltransferase involved in cell wall biosynthesis